MLIQPKYKIDKKKQILKNDKKKEKKNRKDKTISITIIIHNEISVGE
jgi:hypothetical protein